MAAREDEAQAVVAHRTDRRLVAAVVEQGGLGVAVVAGRLAPQPVDGPVAGGRGDPAPGFGGRPVAGQRAVGHDERLLDRLLGEVDVTEEADQGGDDPAGLGPEDPPRSSVGGHAVAPASSWNGRTSTGARQAAAGLGRPRPGRRRGRRP